MNLFFFLSFWGKTKNEFSPKKAILCAVFGWVLFIIIILLLLSTNSIFPGPSFDSGSAASSSSVVAPASGASGETQPLSSISMMDEKVNSDVIFTLSDGKTINTHSFVLSFRCPKLYESYAKKKPKGKSRKPVTVDMKENMNPESFRIVIQFLYADNIDFPSFTPLSVLNIVFASHQLELERLARLGEEHLRSNLNLDMVFSLLKGNQKFLPLFHKQTIDFFLEKRERRDCRFNYFCLSHKKYFDSFF